MFNKNYERCDKKEIAIFNDKTEKDVKLHGLKLGFDKMLL